MSGSSTLQPPCSSDSHATDQNNETTISNVHQDIIETNILTRLDGPTLASVSCVSTHLHELASQEQLWTNICGSTWPSTTSPCVPHVISSFQNGCRFFFSDAFSLPVEPVMSRDLSENFDPPSKLISAVDIYYKKELIFSKVVETETVSAWFNCSPFRVDLLDPKETISIQIPHPDKDNMFKDLEEDLELSWIVIDPIGKRAMDLSSHKPVTVHRHWLTGEVQVKFASVVGGGVIGSATEWSQCGVVVTCEGSTRGYMHVREVSLLLEDMDGMYLNGNDSLVVLKRALDGKRKKGQQRDIERKKEVEIFLEKKQERKDKKSRREGTLDMVCVAFGIVAFASSAVFLVLQHY